MSGALLATLFERAGEFLLACPGARLEIQWHGGEPLLGGPEFYRAAHALAGEHCSGAGGRLRHSMQTNLTLLTETLVEPLLRLGLRSLGTSFDPEPEVRGRGDPPDSRDYAQRFLRGLGVVERHRIPWGLVYVVTRRSLPRPLEAFIFLTNLGPPLGLDLNPMVPSPGSEELAPAPDEYAEFLGAIFPYWYQHRSRFSAVQPFSGLVGARLGRALPAGRGLVVLPDGTVKGTRAGLGGRSEALGHLAESSLEHLLARSAALERSSEAAARDDAGCRGCGLWRECHGLRTMDAFSHHQTLISESPWCHARKRFVEQWVEPTVGVRRRASS
jgi:uncharacterized protein